MSSAHSTGDRAKTENAQLAGSFGPSYPFLRGYPPRGDWGPMGVMFIGGDEGCFGRSGTTERGKRNLRHRHALGEFLEPVAASARR